jgi:hypothetical protein
MHPDFHAQRPTVAMSCSTYITECREALPQMRQTQQCRVAHWRISGR